jgi:catechol 2,3-dioxygenase-like lactoylglutathione lyase family enzyme
LETVIARLVRDFETGAISRRQLIQTLAMVAVGAPLAGAAASAQPAPLAPIMRAAPWKTIWLDHISFSCTDYKKSADFYTSLMGWTVKEGSDNGRQVTCEIGDIGTILIRNKRPTTANPTGGAAAGPNVQAVIDHISFGVSPWDKDAVKKELVDRGLKPTDDFAGGPASGFESYHVKDPDGWDLQISNQNKDKHL